MTHENEPHDSTLGSGSGSRPGLGRGRGPGPGPRLGPGREYMAGGFDRALIEAENEF